VVGKRSHDLSLNSGNSPYLNKKIGAKNFKFGTQIDHEGH